MSMRLLFVLSILCFAAAAFCDDPAPAAAAVVAAPDTVDNTAKWIGYGWAAFTAISALLTGIAAALRAAFPTSAAAQAIDSIAHVAGAIGTSIRPSQIKPPKS